eukprot:gene29133-51073_t
MSDAKCNNLGNSSPIARSSLKAERIKRTVTAASTSGPSPAEGLRTGTARLISPPIDLASKAKPRVRMSSNCPLSDVCPWRWRPISSSKLRLCEVSN